MRKWSQRKIDIFKSGKYYEHVENTDVLIVGAGPFGLSLAAYLKDTDVDFMVVGKPMSFWKENMPEGMLLRSDCNWHLDPTGQATIHAYLNTLGLEPKDMEPLSLQFYLDYTEWFLKEKQIDVNPVFVDRLELSTIDSHIYVASLVNGDKIRARRVVLALGFEYFKHIPENILKLVPSDQLSHTCDLVRFDHLKDKRCLIIGGRQSAFEWAALLRENETSIVHMTYRHETPDFVEAYWDWAPPLIDKAVSDPGYYARLPEDEKERIYNRFWEEGRLKLEPWLWPRIDYENVRLWPKTEVTQCTSTKKGDLHITLSNGEEFVIDHVICATGYVVDMKRIPLLLNGNVLEELKCTDGAPDLDGHFETSVPGLYITSMPATKDFGLFFAFTVSALGSAKILGRALTGSGI